jgi:lycopene cyclase domain-containing protein
VNFRKFYYLFSILFVFFAPALVEGFFIWNRISILNLTVFALGITTIGIMWDIWATRHSNKDTVWVWQFNSRDTLGLKFFDVPVEDYLFCILSSVYSVFTWECLRYISQNNDFTLSVLLVCIFIWTLAGIAFLYIFRHKGDRLT